MQLPDISTLSFEQKIGQLFFVGIPGDEVDTATADLMNRIQPGGVCLFARNIKGAVQTRALLDELRSLSAIEPFLSVDQEGGLVDRLRRILGSMPAASKLSDKAAASVQAEIIAEALSVLGFNMDFAPVVDVVDAGRSRNSNGLHSRAYGSSKEDVVELASTFLVKLQSYGLVGCLKHFPGLGASTVDSHEELPTVNISTAEFEEVDLYPYRQLLRRGGVNAVMVGHAVYPALGLQETTRDGKLLPSSLSYNIVTTLLRKELGFEGLVVTDDLEMGAILKNYGIGESALMAIRAGHDMVCICSGLDRILDAHKMISAAVGDGRLPVQELDDAVRRIMRLKSTMQKPPALDLAHISSLSRRVADLSLAFS